MTDKRPLIKTKQLSEHTGLPEVFFRRARISGDGPAFIKLGKTVLYDLKDVDAWIEARKRTVLSDADRVAA
jgi:predicted DNA-binding transcriptional regulator AlpA